MKKNLIKVLAVALITVFLVNNTCDAQRMAESKVPSAITFVFKKTFPYAVSVKWEQEEKNYEANFKQEGKTMSALIDINGNLLETETNIKISELPKAVTDYLGQHYKDKKIREAAIIKKPNDEITYEAEIRGKDLLFNNKGKFIKEVKN